MEKFNFETIIKLLPFTDTDRADLLNRYKELIDAKKLDFLHEFYTIFYEYKGELENQEYQNLLNEVRQGQAKLDNQLMNKAKIRVREYFDNILAGRLEERVQIDEIRDKLKTFTSK